MHFSRPFLGRQQTEEPLPDEPHRVKAQQQHIRRPAQQQQQQHQQQHRVRIEQHQEPQHVEEEEVLEEEVVEEESPAAVPTRQRVPIASRQPVSEVTPTSTSTEAELPLTTSKVFFKLSRNLKFISVTLFLGKSA